jgi:hypothetical protein
MRYEKEEINIQISFILEGTSKFRKQYQNEVIFAASFAQ